MAGRWRSIGWVQSVVLGAAVAALAAVSIAAASAAVPAGSYTGTTTEKGPISFTVAKGGTAVQSFTVALGYDGKCGQGGGPTFSVAVKSIAVAANGSFQASVTAHDNAIAAVVQVKGSISKSGARGSVSEPKPYFACHAPNQKVNPYAETFTAKRH